MNDELANWKRNAAEMSIIAMWLKTFAGEIIGHVLNGNTLDYEAVQQIKAQCVRDLKNLDVIGLGIKQEADILGKAIEHFEQMADMAIADGWKLKGS